MGSLPTDQHPKPITRLYAEKLRERREQAGLTQKRAAEAADVSQAKISRWESGAAQPDLTELRGLATAYECKLIELMPRNQYPNAPLDPAERQEHFWRRNAKIQGVADVDAYVKEKREKRDGVKGSPRPDA